MNELDVIGQKMKNSAKAVDASCNVVSSCVTQWIAGQNSSFSTFLASRVWGEGGEAVFVGGELSTEAVLVQRQGM